MNVGRYYMEHKDPVAAINRFKTVVTDYQTTAHVEEALYRLTVAYMSLGIASEAQNAAAVLGHNFPNSSWYKEFLRAAAERGPAAAATSSSWFASIFGSSPKKVQPAATQPPPAAPPVAAPPAQQKGPDPWVPRGRPRRRHSADRRRRCSAARALKPRLRRRSSPRNAAWHPIYFVVAATQGIEIHKIGSAALRVR